MHTYQKVSSNEAMKLIQVAVRMAEEYGGAMAVAVCGPEGELIAYLRMDNVNPSSSVISQNKAYTAARNRTETFKLGERMRTKDNPMFWGDPRFTGFGGGIPIYQGEVVVGSIGISGLPEEEDIRIAKAVIAEVIG